MPEYSGDGGTLYTIQFEDESSEFDKFLQNKEVREDQAAFERLLSKLGAMIQEYGFGEEFFKVNEGKRGDYVVALSEQKIRLYCLRIESVLLIVGNGGVKTTRTYQQDPHLKASVEELQMVHRLVMGRIYSGSIRVDHSTGKLRGLLSFVSGR